MHSGIYWRKRVMKKITRRSFITVCGAAAAAMALTACGGAASSTVASSAAESASSSAAAETAAGTLSGNVATGGSTSMKNVIAALTEGFAEVEPGVTVSYDPTGSGAGITGATDKTLDIGLSSRALKDDEKNDVDGTIVALDGIAIVVNKDSKVADLTVDQLKQMFTGEITNWKDVGGDDGEIVLVGREAGSGTRDGFESIVDVKDSCKYAQELTATGAVISAVEANPLAVGYASLSAVGDTVAMVTVEGVECSSDTPFLRISLRRLLSAISVSMFHLMTSSHSPSILDSILRPLLQTTLQVPDSTGVHTLPCRRLYWVLI